MQILDLPRFLVMTPKAKDERVTMTEAEAQALAFRHACKTGRPVDIYDMAARITWTVHPESD